MSLDMFGHIDETFTSSIGTRIARSGGDYVNGRWVEGIETESPHNVNIQPMNMKQIQTLQIGGERIQDYRNVWVNDGLIGEIAESDTWTFIGIEGTFKTTMLDNRANYLEPYNRNYCKFVAVRIDPS